MDSNIYDIIGIGIGPFNLGLAAITHDLPELSCLFLEQKPAFDWHPGLLLPGARMQVPFFADLVGILHPQSPFTYYSFLQKTGRFFKFANNDNIFPLRIEYNRYCQWVARQLPSLRFNHCCANIYFDEATSTYHVETNQRVFHGKHLVLGTGTTPAMPETLTQLNQPLIFHSGEYLLHKDKLLQQKRITIIGSGQSAAEILYDLLPYADELDSLSWFTRSNRFHPMDYSRLTTEMTSQDYIDYFYSLDDAVKAAVLHQQRYLYNGINMELISQISDALYVREASGGKPNITIQANSDLLNARMKFDTSIELHLWHKEKAEHSTHCTDAVIAATGYADKVPTCVHPLKDHIDWKTNGLYNIKRDYSIDCNNTLFVQNADLHTHGFNSADLAMGPYRNATILNAILKKEHFSFERNTGFQSF